MVFVKTGYKKRYYKKGKRPLAKKNIFKNKTAKSQAGQIYALKKKVNNLAYHIRPETQICDCKMFERVMTTDGAQASAGVSEWHGNQLVYAHNLFNPNRCNYVMRGTKLRPYNFTIYGSFGNKNISYVSNSGTSSAVSLNTPLIGYIRIIICKLNPQQINLPNQITRPMDTAAVNDFGLINGPLVEDVSSSFKIVSNKVVKVDHNTPQKMFKIVVKNPGVVAAGATSAAGITTYKNEYMIYLQYWCPDVLLDAGNQVAPKHYLTMGIKYAFVDTD